MLRKVTAGNVLRKVTAEQADNDYLSEIGISSVKDCGPEPSIERYLKKYTHGVLLKAHGITAAGVRTYSY